MVGAFQLISAFMIVVLISIAIALPEWRLSSIVTVFTLVLLGKLMEWSYRFQYPNKRNGNGKRIDANGKVVDK